MKLVSRDSKDHLLRANCRSVPQSPARILLTFLGIVILTSGAGTRESILGKPPQVSALAVATVPGTKMTGSLSLTPTTSNFGITTLNLSASLPVLVTNTGTASVTITSVGMTGTAFTLKDLSLPLTLNAGQSKSFSVDFAPTAAGAYSATATLYSNAKDSPSSESLSGTGRASHSVSLSWKASTSKGVTGYNVYRGLTSGGPYVLLTAAPIAGTSYTDDAVNAGTTYYYVTTAVASGKQSGDSNQASAKVP